MFTSLRNAVIWFQAIRSAQIRATPSAMIATSIAGNLDRAFVSIHSGLVSIAEQQDIKPVPYQLLRKDGWVGKGTTPDRESSGAEQKISRLERKLPTSVKLAP